MGGHYNNGTFVADYILQFRDLNSSASVIAMAQGSRSVLRATVAVVTAIALVAFFDEAVDSDCKRWFDSRALGGLIGERILELTDA